jgi:hypothetical protein
MNILKKPLATLAIATTIAVGAMTLPAKDAKAGVIIGVAACTVPAIPAALAIVGPFVGMGAVITSVYWAIDHRDKSWWAWGLFMLDEEIQNGQVSTLVAQKYPELDSYLVEELSTLIKDKSQNATLVVEGYKEIVFTKEELSPITNVLKESNPELSNKIEQELTGKSLKAN